MVHLGERECSIQRRHQKIVEEAPSSGITDEQREALCAAAVRLGEHIGYTNAGTVEFIVDEDSGDFFFLEVNTRLQVEHPVTEESRWLDLVDIQLDVAEGQRLDADLQETGALEHAIEVRLYAEDPSADFLPATGPVDVLTVGDGARFDLSVDDRSSVTTAFDPMIGKVIASGETRDEAAVRVARALEQMHFGGLTTNREFLINVLRSDAFLAGDTTTDFIERVQPAPTLELTDDELFRAAVTGALWLQGRNRDEAEIQEHMPSGWRIGRLPPEKLTLARGDDAIDVHYRRDRDGGFLVSRAGEDGSQRAVVHEWGARSLDVEIDGRRFAGPVTCVEDRLHVQTRRGTVSFTIVPRFSPPEVEGPTGGLVAPMPGQILEVRVAEGDTVTEGQILVVMEAMKMEQHVKAPHAGVVADVRVAEGDQVEQNGAALLVVEELEG